MAKFNPTDLGVGRFPLPPELAEVSRPSVENYPLQCNSLTDGDTPGGGER